MNVQSIEVQICKWDLQARTIDGSATERNWTTARYVTEYLSLCGIHTPDLNIPLGTNIHTMIVNYLIMFLVSISYSSYSNVSRYNSFWIPVDDGVYL